MESSQSSSFRHISKCFNDSEVSSSRVYNQPGHNNSIYHHFWITTVGLLAYELLDLVINLFSHSNIQLNGKLDQFLRILIATPGMHRIHHSSFIKETNNNYGVVFSFWDQFFRTYQHKQREELPRINIGLDEERVNASKLKFLLYDQFFKQDST